MKKLWAECVRTWGILPKYDFPRHFAKIRKSTRHFAIFFLTKNYICSKEEGSSPPPSGAPLPLGPQSGNLWFRLMWTNDVFFNSAINQHTYRRLHLKYPPTCHLRLGGGVELGLTEKNLKSSRCLTIMSRLPRLYRKSCFYVKFILQAKFKL